MGRRLACYQQRADNAGSFTMEIPAEEQILHAATYRMTDVGVADTSQRVLSDTVVNNRLTWTAPAQGWILVVVTAQPHDLDYLDPSVADRWLHLHLGAFADRLPEFVGNTLAAYGPDEMYVLRGNILYSSTLIARFRREKGYDPLSFLTGLFLDIGAHTDKIRCEYYEVMISLLDENFYRRITDWLHERGMRYTTIATWGRESPVLQTYHYGDFFRMMRHFDMTGNEDPGPADVAERHLIDAKFSSSIAHLGGRERSAVCAYWGSGWGATQQQNVAWTLANYAFGLNFYNGHGGLYSTLGGWYEWVPPAIQFRQPYWQYWRYFTDWVRRLSCLMSQGTHVADVAILYPLTTMHAGWAGEENFSEAAREAGDTVMRLANVIYRNGIDFDFIDDHFLSQATVNNGKLAIAGHALQAVVLPPLTTIRRDTLAKLHTFQAAGGVVLAFGRLPDASPEYGRDDPVVRSLIEEMFGNAPVAREGNGQAFFIPENIDQVPSCLSTAIARDVTVSESGVFHTHQKAGETDIILLVNTQYGHRRVTVTVRTCGEPEIWNSFTGDTHPIYCFDTTVDTTIVHLDMAPYQGIVLVVTPSRGRPRVTEHNLNEIRDIRMHDGRLHIDGWCNTRGRKALRLAYDNVEYTGEAEVADPPAEITLDGAWMFRLQPTLDNRWGDFRYPPADEMIGPEARQFRCREEDGENGVALGWHESDFDDGDWPRVLYTHGPYWWRLGPFGETNEPRHIIDKVINGGFDPAETFDLAARPFRWEPTSFSQQFGAWPGVKSFGGLEGVADEFLAFEEIPGGQSIVRYLFTYVVAPEEGAWIFAMGGAAYFPRQAWINGRQVSAEAPEGLRTATRVRLQQGPNAILVRFVQPRGVALNIYITFFEPAIPPAANPRIPVLRWFQEPQRLRFDATPDRPHRVGWYRFLAPPGLRAFRGKLHAGTIEAWVDGKPVATQSGDCSPDAEAVEINITVDAARKTCSRIALRVALTPGRYAGAAFDEPVFFTCEDGEIPLGDWCDYGLEMYSGAATYARAFELERCHLEGMIWLDLGTVATVGEVFVNGKTAGVGMYQPFRFDITDFVREGENLLEVRVANTLANHMSSFPTGYIFPGQTLSGLLGPVRLQFARRVMITAVHSGSVRQV